MRIMGAKTHYTFETYDGDHVNHVSDRMVAQVIPFFGGI